MKYANSDELYRFHDTLLAMCKKYAISKNQTQWGFPSGVIYCDTYLLNTRQGMIYIGHEDFVQEQRWWIPIVSEERISGDQLSIDFEMNIPKTRNIRLAVHYAIDEHNNIHVLHKGKFTVGHGSVSMLEFFNYYRRTPGTWQIKKFNNYDYLVLGEVSLIMTDTDFTKLLESLAKFARYIPKFKDTYR
jgi:hypothetical protein